MNNPLARLKQEASYWVRGFLILECPQIKCISRRFALIEYTQMTQIRSATICVPFDLEDQRERTLGKPSRARQHFPQIARSQYTLIHEAHISVDLRVF